MQENNRLTEKHKAINRKETNMDTPLVSIVIPVFNKVEYTKQCIDSLYSTLGLPGNDIEIIIVDNNSTDETKSYLKTLPDCFKVITNNVNLGCGKAMNQGAKIARGKYLVFLNNDTIALPGWLEELINVIETEKNVGMVGCKLLFPDGTIQHAGVTIDRNLTVAHIYYTFPGDFPDANKFRDYPAVTGACILMKKELFLDVGCYDENYMNSHLDIDLCLKVREKGYRVVYTPNSVLYHYESVSEGRHDHDLECSTYFYNKWKNKYNRPAVEYRDLTSIIIPCFQKVNFTKLCIENILAYSCKPFELILINNGSDDSTEDYFKELGHKHANVKIINNSTNTGYGAACNQGIEAAEGTCLLFMHNDVIVTRNWLYRLLTVGELYKEAGIIAPVTNAAPGVQLVDDVPYRSELEMHAFAGKIARDYEGKGYYTDRVHGCCMLVKKEVIEKIGGFDPRFEFLKFEDHDLCLRARIAGYKIAVCSDVFVHHFGGWKSKSTGLDYGSLLAENWNKFKEKWNIPRERRLDQGYTPSRLISQPFNPDLHYCPVK